MQSGQGRTLTVIRGALTELKASLAGVALDAFRRSMATFGAERMSRLPFGLLDVVAIAKPRREIPEQVETGGLS